MVALLQDDYLKDAVLYVDNQSIGAHRHILSAGSDYFREVFRAHAAAGNCCTNKTIVCMQGVRANVVQAILEFLYLGETFVNENDLAELLRVAEEYRIKGLCTEEGLNNESTGGEMTGQNENSPPPPAVKPNPLVDSFSHLLPGFAASAGSVQQHTPIIPAPLLDLTQLNVNYRNAEMLHQQFNENLITKVAHAQVVATIASSLHHQQSSPMTTMATTTTTKARRANKSPPVKRKRVNAKGDSVATAHGKDDGSMAKADGSLAGASATTNHTSTPVASPTDANTQDKEQPIADEQQQPTSTPNSTVIQPKVSNYN